MSENRRYKQWKKKSKIFYQKRDIETKRKRLINIEKSKEFIRGCRRTTGFSARIDLNEIDFESTMAGIGCYNLLNLNIDCNFIKENWNLNKINSIWRLKVENNNYTMTSQKIYRYAMLVKMSNLMNNQNSEKITNVVMDLFEKNRNKLTRPTGVRSLRNLYELIAALKICNTLKEEHFISVIGYENLNLRKIGIQPLYNYICLESILKRRFSPDMLDSIKNIIKNKESVDGYRSKPNHHPNIWDLFCVINLTSIIDFRINNPMKINLYLSRCQDKNGGFRSSLNEGRGSLTRTYAALFIYKVISNEFNNIEVHHETGIISYKSNLRC